MHKNKHEYIFMPIGGIWRNVADDSGTLAEALEKHNIIIDDKCQFARMYDYENSRCIEYRHYDCMRIKLTIYDI